MPISLNGDGIVSGVTTFTTSVTGVTTFSSVVIGSGSTSAPSISPSGDSNTGVFFPSADTIAFAEGGSEVARFDSSGRLGIGTIPKTWSSAYNVLHVGAASLVGQSEQDGTTSNWSNNAYFDTNDNRWEYSGADQASQITQSDGLIIFKTASTGSANAAISWTESARFNTSGNLAFPSGQGIDFSATANSSGTMTSELLSDYEEGTWTPTLNATSGETYSSRAGTYTKIGNIVHVVGQIVLSNKGSSTGNLTFGTLPFTKRSLDSSRTPFVIYYENLTTSVNNLWGYQDETTRFLIYKVTGTGTNPTLFAHADLANNTVLNFSFVYPTT
jgi:hypothetical protein